MSLVVDLFALFSGAVVGFSLGLIGGGGSILAVPLLIYVVGVSDTHIAIGTSAAAVAASALINLLPHAYAGTVKWRCALTFASFGIIGVIAGSTLGKMTNPDLLLGLFGLVMVIVGSAMLLRQDGGDDPEVHLDAESALRLTPRLAGGGVVVGALSGFFGIGGGFLIVPGLIAATAMPTLNAIGSSLISVSLFGATTAANYALDDLIDWWIVAIFLAGGVAGGGLGVWLAQHLKEHKGRLKQIFSLLVIGVGVYIAGKGGYHLWQWLQS